MGALFILWVFLPIPSKWGNKQVDILYSSRSEINILKLDK